MALPEDGVASGNLGQSVSFWWAARVTGRVTWEVARGAQGGSWARPVPRPGWRGGGRGLALREAKERALG